MRSSPLLAVLVGASSARAFTASRRRHGHGPISIRPSPSAPDSDVGVASGTTALRGRRRGGLGGNVSLDDDGNVKLVSNKRKQKMGNAPKRNKKGGKKGDGAATAISPLLAEWAKEEDDDGTTVATAPARTTARRASTSSAAAPSASDVFVPFDEEDDDVGGMGKRKKKGNKKQKNRSNRAVLSAAQSARTDEILERISDALSTANCDVAALVSDVRALVDLGGSFSNDRTLLPALKSILSARPPPAKRGEGEVRPAYRLAWAGSDDAICHVGTSLHKVPLARLEEMFVLLGYNRWELLEVIRVLGPFPNVRNTLKGEIKVKKLKGGEREGVRMDVEYSSMVDGTGKEILAGKEDDVKRAGLDVWFASERAIVCTVARDDEEGEGGDPLTGDGSDILFFVREEALDEALVKLRAA